MKASIRPADRENGDLRMCCGKCPENPHTHAAGRCEFVNEREFCPYVAVELLDVVEVLLECWKGEDPDYTSTLADFHNAMERVDELLHSDSFEVEL